MTKERTNQNLVGLLPPTCEKKEKGRILFVSTNFLPFFFSKAAGREGHDRFYQKSKIILLKGKRRGGKF